MQHASLTSFLNCDGSAEDLWREIEMEVTACLAACAKGGAGPVIITAGPPTILSRGHVITLIEALADAKLPMNAASYIADAIIMSDDFDWEDEGIADAMFRLSDDSAPLTMSDLDWARASVSPSS